MKQTEMAKGPMVSFLVVMFIAILLMDMTAFAQGASQPRYLLFQIFTYGAAMPEGKGVHLITKAEITQLVDEVLNAVGQKRGDHVNRQIGFVIGPLALDMTDTQIRALIKEMFVLAEVKDVAVGFHIDDSMFYKRRKDLWSNHDNVEWSDWQGTIVPHRFLAWGGPENPAVQLAPPMCYNSPTIKAEVSRIARDVIGAEIKKGMDHLQAIGKPYLFAGVISGWETRMQDDSNPPRYYGYCALHNLGFSAQKPPSDPDAELVGVLTDWNILWDKSLRGAGIPRERIYTHVAYPGEPPPGAFVNPVRDLYHHATPETAFNDYSRPGFTIYGQVSFSSLYKVLERHGNIPWGISEGNNIPLNPDIFNGSPFTPPVTMEHYLAKAFNHGADYVNLFGWGTHNSPFEQTLKASLSLSAFQRFLDGEQLEDGPPLMEGDEDWSLPKKIRKIQTEAPVWASGHPERQAKIAPLFQKLESAIKANKFQQANHIAGEILALISTT